MLNKTYLNLFIVPFLFASCMHGYSELIDQDVLNTFTTFVADLPTKVKALTKNEQGCLINLFAGQFEILKHASSTEMKDQEELISTLQGFKKITDDFENQCSQAVKEFYEILQKNIAELTPETLIQDIKATEEEANKLMAKAEKKGNAKSKDFEKSMQELQEKYMSSMIALQTIHMEASLEIYDCLYKTIKTINPQGLLKRYDVTGLIPLTKRKASVIAPEEIEKIMALFFNAAQEAA